MSKTIDWFEQGQHGGTVTTHGSVDGERVFTIKNDRGGYGWLMTADRHEHDPDDPTRRRWVRGKALDSANKGTQKLRALKAVAERILALENTPEEFADERARLGLNASTMLAGLANGLSLDVIKASEALTNAKEAYKREQAGVEARHRQLLDKLEGDLFRAQNKAQNKGLAETLGTPV